MRYGWYVVAVLMAGYTLSFIDRQILSLMVRPIKLDLGLSDTQVGMLQGLAFSLFYTLCGLPLGRVADRANRRNLIALGVFFWSIFTALCGAARSFWTLFAARIGVGVGEATLSPAAMSLIADYFPPQKLGAALSVYSMGIFVGSGLAFLLGGSVVEAVTKGQALFGVMAPWRVTFVVVGLPGLLVALWVRTLVEPSRKKALLAADGSARRLTIGETMAELRLRWKPIAGISLANATHAIALYGFNAWAPAFLQRTYGWGPGQSGRWLGLIVLLAGCGGMYLGGVLTDRWQRQKRLDAPLRTGVLAAAGAIVCFPMAFVAVSPAATLFWLAPAVAFIALPIGSTYAALQIILPNQLRGQVSALFMFIVSLCGISLGPLIPGVLNDYVFHDEHMLGRSLALTLGGASVFTAVLFRATFAAYVAARRGE